MTISLDKAVDIVREHHPYAWAWEESDLCDWVAWFNKEHLLLCTTVDDKTIAGLVMLRTVMCANDGCDNTLNYDPEGPVVFVDFTYAPSGEILRALTVQAIKRVGRRNWIAWQRRGVLRIYPATRFVNDVLKEKEDHVR